MKPGDRIAAFIEYGGNARHALVRAEDAIVVGSSVDDARVAAVILNYGTAIGMVEAGGLTKGDDFLINGATGGVGSAVLDVGRALGLAAIGTTRGNTSADIFGARLLDARSPSLVEDVLRATNGGARAAFDSRAGRGLWQSRAMVGRGGSLVVYGLSSVAKPGIGAALGTVGTRMSLGLFRLLPGKRSAIFAMDKTYHRHPARIRAWVGRALEMLAAGEVAPIIGATLPLERVAEAHCLLETGAVVGKIVIDCR